MFHQSLILAVALSICGIRASDSTPSPTCNTAVDTGRSWTLSVRRIRNESGEWTTFTALKDWTDSFGTSDVDVKQTLFDCDGRKMVKIQGFLKDPFESADKDVLMFHHKTGPNAVLINHGRTVTKLKPEESGVVFTSRPLRINEVWEVMLDKRGTDKGYATGIGVTTRKPEDGDLPGHMNSLKSGTWMLYGVVVFQNGAILISSYTPTNISNLKAGDRIGVMRSDTGALHFFINGVDQGPAASNIPENVYGAYELYGDAMQATVYKK